MRVGRVCALEAYLGGALPPEGGGVVTWRQEREQLQTTITVREMCFCVFFTELNFWPKTMDYSQVFLPKFVIFPIFTEIEVIFYGPFTPQWRVL